MFLRLALFLLLFAAFFVSAAKADPMVVAGLYPGERLSRAVEAQPAAEEQPDLGGGFLEMLFTGGAVAEPGPLRRNAAYGASPERNTPPRTPARSRRMARSIPPIGAPRSSIPARRQARS